MLEGDEIAWHSKSDFGPSETKSLADNVDADGDTESNTDGSTGGCSPVSYTHLTLPTTPYV